MPSYQAEHMYMTLHWEGVAGTSMAGERWQIGVRLTHLNPLTDTNAPRWTQKSLATIQDAAASESTATLDIDYGFDATTGPTNLQGAIYTKDRQKDFLEDARLFAGGLQTYFTNQWRYVGSKLYPLNAAIQTPTGAPKSLTAPTVSACRTPIVGTATGSALPPQNAIAVSLLTTARGRGSKGRFYVGGLSTNAIGTTGQLNSSMVTALNAATKTFVTNLNNSPGIDPIYAPALVVWHRKDNSFSRVNAIAVGNLMDTQRRRRRQLVETYTEVTTLDSGPAQAAFGLGSIQP
jgi:hypothetical protein